MNNDERIRRTRRFLDALLHENEDDARVRLGADGAVLSWVINGWRHYWIGGQFESNFSDPENWIEVVW